VSDSAFRSCCLNQPMRCYLPLSPGPRLRRSRWWLPCRSDWWRGSQQGQRNRGQSYSFHILFSSVHFCGRVNWSRRADRLLERAFL